MNQAPAMAGADLGYANQTTLHPVGVAVLCACLAAGLLLPRRTAMVPLLVLVAFIPSAQRVVVATLDFNLVRLMVLGMLARITLRNEWIGFRLRGVDWVLLAWAGWSIVAYGLVQGQFGAVVTRSGYMIEAVGAYFAARVLLQDMESWRRVARWCAVLALVSLVFFIIELGTRRNLFSAFGGVPEVTQVREGRLRCQGPFSHPIMAGVLWASLLPIFGALLVSDVRSRVLMALGMGAALVIVATTASSTPAMAVIIGAAAMALYPVRRFTPAIRLAVLAALPVLHMVMNKGVHHLLARVNVVGGSTGWHRYHLMDEAIKHFPQWAAIGTRSTAHWGWGLQDVTNQYVLEGVRGGFLALAFFAVWLIAIFVALSKTIRRERDDRRRLVLWACGAMMFTHCLNFLAVSYFGQMVSAFFLFAGMTVSFATAPARTSNQGATPPRVAVPSGRAGR